MEQAAAKGDLRKLKTLMREGADPNERDPFSGYTALHWAADGGHVDCVKFLLNKGCRIDDQTEEGDTPLHVAYMFTHRKLIKYLLKSGADPTLKNDSGQTPEQVQAVKSR
jgi:ankyrin repeat protein